MPEGSRSFLDTNALLYLHDRHDARKRADMQIWLDRLTDDQSAVTNLQVLNELTYVLLRKKWFSTVDEAFLVVQFYSIFGDTPISGVEVNRARDLYRRYRYAWWDCILIASALELGCRFFLSEDLQDGQGIEGLTIVDPFAHSPDQIFSIR